MFPFTRYVLRCGVHTNFDENWTKNILEKPTNHSRGQNQTFYSPSYELDRSIILSKNGECLL